MLGSDILFVVTFFCLKPLANWMFASFPDCIFLKLGFPCPSCGGTRAVFYFASGHFPESFQHNAFFFFLMIYILLCMAVLNAEILFHSSIAKKIRTVIIQPASLIVVTACYGLFGIIRILL